LSGTKVRPGSPGRALAQASRQQTLTPARDWRPVQKRMLAASGSASMPPATITCRCRPAIAASSERAAATAWSSRFRSKFGWWKS
jgi:hypothetical protein